MRRVNAPEQTELQIAECNGRCHDSFWKDVSVRGNDECWLWLLSKSANGYGSAKHGDVTWTAHRMAWHVANRRLDAPLPRTIQIRHTCDVRLCCNPRHLIIGTANDNAQDAVKRGRTNGGKPRGRSHAAIRHRIFELADAGTPKMTIARELGMSERNVHYHLSKRKDQP